MVGVAIGVGEPPDGAICAFRVVGRRQALTCARLAATQGAALRSSAVALRTAAIATPFVHKKRGEVGKREIRVTA